jgi:hypothetical protein
LRSISRRRRERNAVFKFIERLLAPRCLQHIRQPLHREMTDWGICQYFCPACRWARADRQQQQVLKDMQHQAKKPSITGWLDQDPVSLPGLTISPMRQRAQQAADRAWLWRLRVLLVAPEQSAGVVPVSDVWLNDRSDQTMPMLALAPGRRRSRNLETRSLPGMI